MSPWHDMALDAGYRGEEARALAAQLEQDEMERYAQRMADQCAAELEDAYNATTTVDYLEYWMAPGWML